MKQHKVPSTVVRSALKAAVSCRKVLVAAALAAACMLAAARPAAIQKVETANAILSFKAESGDLIGVQWKHPRLEIIDEPKLGENFRILLPKPGFEAAYFNSRDQVLSKLEASSNHVVLHYGPLRNEEETVDLKVTYEIRDTGTQLQFSIQVDNATDRKLAEVFYGIVGGQHGIDQRLETESLVPSGYYNLAPKLFSQYNPYTSGTNLGNRFDSVGYSYPGGMSMSMGWMDIYNIKAGVGYYYANQDSETRLTTLYTEMHPQTKPIGAKDNWLSANELPHGEPIGLTMGWVNFPYTSKGIFRAGPIALQVHEGDWHSAAKLYRAWFDRHFKVARAPSWLRKEMAWQSMIISNPEDVIRYRFRDLARLAADAKRYGVTTFDILGWNVGGLDRGYPAYTPDPRLGTATEFRKALADMRAMGVHPLLFGNIQVADTSTEAFRTRLARYAVEGRWAQDWNISGFGEGTIGARTSRATSAALRRNMASLSPSHPEFREEIVRQYLDRIEDGAEGLDLDKTVWAARLDFNARVPASPDKSMLQGVLATFDEFLNRARKINPDIGLAAEDYFDRAIPYVDVSRINMDTPGKDANSVALRYTFPEWVSMILVETPADFDRVNNGLRYGLVWVMAPRHYNDSMDEALTRPLSRYVSELIRVRKQYADLLFHGRFSDTLGAKVIGNAENIRYSVFEPMSSDNSRRACVVVNFGDGDEVVEVGILGMEGREASISTPFQPDRVAILPVKLTLPPHRAAVVVAGESASQSSLVQER